MTTIKLWETAPGLCEEEPILEYYPAAEKRTDATVVIFPGGGYARRAAHEGQGYAEYLNSIGMDAFVLQYRCNVHHFPHPLADARRAVRTVRARKNEFGIDPEKIAVMGSSAGGHLAAMASTYFAPLGAEWEELDEIDKQECAPNATILCYPVINISNLAITHIGTLQYLLADRIGMAPALDPALTVNEKTPMAFIWHTSDDGGVNVINSYRYAEALRKQNIPTEMHIFPKGPHGLGLAPSHPHVAQWASLLQNWFIYNGWRS